MITIEGLTADAVWRQAIEKLQGVTAVQVSRDQATRELLHASFTIADPRQRIVFGRPINPAFAIAEIIWILSGANDSAFLRFWNPRMKQFLDADERRFHGAYGYRLGSQPKISEKAATRLRHEVTANGSFRLDQLKTAYEALLNTPHSRQVVLQIWDRELDIPNPNPRSKDVPCNLMSHLLIRNGKLEWLQVMRSNDLIWGTPYNFIQFTTMQEVIAGWLGVEVGSYNHISDSLHVYERHWAEMGAIEVGTVNVPRNHADLCIGPYEAWEKVWARLVDGALRLTEVEDVAGLLEIEASLSDLPVAYRQWVALLTAEALRRRGHTTEADVTVLRAGEFWATSWQLWAATVAERAAQPQGSTS